jgi:predicted Zn-dependent protease
MKRILALFVSASALSCHMEWGQKAKWNGDAPWAKTPITVEWTTIDPVFDDSFKRALGAWNYAAGCQVLARAHDAATANVSISAYDGTMCGWLANLETITDATAGTKRCSADRAEVKFRTMSDIRSAFVIAEHELGHVLGLAHDRSSLMQAAPPLYEPQNLGGSPALMPLPSDADGAAVKARYCKGAL